MIIDFHTHIFPDKIASLAFETLSINAKAAGYAPIHKLTKDTLLERMDEFQVDLSVICPVSTKPSQTLKNLTWGKEIECERLTSLAGIFPEKESWRNNVDTALALGYKGIKLHPEYQNFLLFSEEMLPLYDYAFNKGMFILFHAGYDPIGKEPFKSNPEMFCRLIETFKGAKIVAAHFGGQSQWDDVEKYLAGTDVYLDTSMGFKYFSREQFLRIFRKHGADKILFGSDSPWSHTGEEIACLKSLPITESDKEKILHENAEKLLGIF